MALDNFIEKFSTRYQEVFNKVLVGMKIANTRFQSNLTYGESVTRIKYDMSNVVVRAVTDLQDRTIDSVSDSEQTLLIDQHYGTTFPISRTERVKAGPLSPANVLGGQAAIKLATHTDASILSEVRNMTYDFDNGDLTGTTSDGTPITLNATSVPQMVAQAPAKLRSKNQTLTNLVWVLDSYSISKISQYRMGKEIDSAGAEFRNGNTDADLGGGIVYVSENLTGEAVLSLATQPTDGDTISVGGVTFTFKATPAAAGDVDLGADVDASRANLEAAINGGAGAGTNYIEVSTADRATLTALRITATNDNTANTLTVVGIGSGRLTVAETLTDATDTWTKNFIHAYFGKKGAIDVVIQDKVDVDIRPEPRQRTDNLMSDILYGKKVFDDGKEKALDVLIAA